LTDHCGLIRRNVAPAPEGWGDLRETFDYWTQPVAGNNNSATWPKAQNMPPAPAGWQHNQFPRRIASALVEVAFHDNQHDAALLSQAWFRRCAGEAISMAVEDQLRANPDPLIRAEMTRLLRADFGPTLRIQGLLADNTGMVANATRDYLMTATGEAVLVPAANLDAAVTAVETARSRYTRQIFVTALRDALAERAGYPNGAAAQIEQFVTAPILSGATMANLSRPNAPITRAEAASFIASALGWSPANLDTVLGRQVGGNALMPQLDGAAHPDKFIPSIEATDLMAGIQVIDPLEIYQVTDLYLADEQFNNLGGESDHPRQYTLRTGDRIRLAANMRGIPWRVEVNNHLQFSIRNSSGFNQAIAGADRNRRRLASAVWTVALPASGRYQLLIAINHQTQPNKTLRHEAQAQLSVLSEPLTE
jgi:hypothetical protein